MKEFALAAALLAFAAVEPTSTGRGPQASTAVSSTSELARALRTAGRGDVILLAPGDYQGLVIQGVNVGGVVIRSAKPDMPAVVGPFTVQDSSGITFRDLELSNVGAQGHWSWQVLRSRDIHFDGLDVHGSLDGNPQNDRQGIQIRWSSKISIKNSRFHELYRCVSPSETSDIEITGNRFHDNARTGIFSSNVQNILVARNTFTDSYPVEGDHMDAIAFTRIGKTNTTQDVVVADNVISRGNGRVTQGIFFRDSTGVSRFKNVQIRNNLLVGMGLNGIFVSGAENVTVEGNTVLAYPGRSNNSWILLMKVDGGKVSGNRAPLISVKPPINKNLNVVETGNQIIAPVTDGGAAALAARATQVSR